MFWCLYEFSAAFSITLVVYGTFHSFFFSVSLCRTHFLNLKFRYDIHLFQLPRVKQQQQMRCSNEICFVLFLYLFCWRYSNVVCSKQRSRKYRRVAPKIEPSVHVLIVSNQIEYISIEIAINWFVFAPVPARRPTRSRSLQSGKNNFAVKCATWFSYQYDQCHYDWQIKSKTVINYNDGLIECCFQLLEQTIESQINIHIGEKSGVFFMSLLMYFVFFFCTGFSVDFNCWRTTVCVCQRRCRRCRCCFDHLIWPFTQIGLLINNIYTRLNYFRAFVVTT